MANYGHRIIETLFKRRTERPAISAEFANRSKTDSDRSDIGVFEVGLSAEQYGNYEQSTGIAAQETEGERLIAIAKEHGFFIDKSRWDGFGERKRLPSGESIVYLSDDCKMVIKLRSPFSKSVIKQLHAEDAIYEHIIHNILFPATRYQFIGVTQDTVGVRIVLAQKYIADIFTIPSQEHIDRYLIEGLGLTPENRYFYGNDYVAVTDVSAYSDNVLSDGEKLYFIDPIIRFKKPALEVLNYYYKMLNVYDTHTTERVQQGA